MEEQEPRESEPEVHPCAEQTDSFSLIISAEEEATEQRNDLGPPSAGEDGMTNGHDGEDGEDDLVTPLGSLGTSYWSVTEGPDSPFLLLPVPGPSGHMPAPARPERASRPGLSRIPGRDHRRYYHEYWRSEYLMDFDPRRHGMICMVCGSSLATLKLSTIKRHIRQKHPDSLLWSAADKEVIRSGWESHLSMEGGQRPYCVAGGAMQEQEELLDCARRSTGKPDAVSPKRQPPSGSSSAAPSPPAPAGLEPPGPSAQTLERYLNDSLHAWFRQEFLMEYEAEAGRLVCMVCGSPLPSLHLNHIKSHVLDTHPNSLVYSAEEKHCILQTWSQAHESGPLRSFFKTEPDTKDLQDSAVAFFPPETEALQERSGAYDEGGSVPSDAGGAREPSAPPGPRRFPRKRRLRGGFPWRLRLDYLVAYGPQGRGCFCMVCAQALPVAKVSGFRRHIQDCHPETTALGRREREAVADAWAKEAPTEDRTAPVQEEAAPCDIVALSASEETGGRASPLKSARQGGVKTEEGVSVKGEPREGAAAAGRHGHYPGKDQRRNYQVRWRMEYLMDYDCRRHGLICMVCGATLATLKVSTIKRHIQQVHPHSLAYGADERQQALLSYGQTALHFVHSEDCFPATDHGHTAHAGGRSGFFAAADGSFPSGMVRCGRAAPGWPWLKEENTCVPTPL